MRCGAPIVHPGGGGINVARVITRLGGSTTAIFPAGGLAGELLQQLLAAEHVKTSVVSIADETRENFTVTDESSGSQYRFVLPGATLTAEELHTCIDRAVRLADESTYVVLSGSLPPGAPDDTYAGLARRLSERGARVILDSAGAALTAALEAGVYLIKPSLRELEALVGARLADTASRLAACRRLIAAGKVEMIALSLGGEGAMLVQATQAWQATALRVPVVTTVGAGDSFLAGLMLALAEGREPDQALRRASAVSAASLLRPGTALCLPEDVARLQALAEVRSIPAIAG